MSVVIIGPMNEPVVVRRLVGVTADGTLQLDAAQRTVVLPEEAGAVAPTIAADGATVPASSESTDSSLPTSDDGPTSVAAGERYATLGRVGRGAMGEVLLAHDRQLLRKVAFKRIIQSLADNPSVVARFFAEAQVTAQLDHPNVVPIYDLDVPADGPLGYSMKLVHGRTLTEVIADARNSVTEGDIAGERVGLTERLEWFLRVCDAIAHAHDKGVLHRDLKPDNIMVGGRGEVYVMDWGICRLIGVDGDNDEDEVATEYLRGGTKFGAIVGTPAYMSPEQAQGRVHELDRRSDLYALGLILAELVTLVPAIGGKTVEDTIALAATGTTHELVHHNRRVRIPRELRAIITKATATERDGRYSDVGAFAEDLRAYLRGDGVAASPDSFLQAAGRRLMRHKLAVFAVVALLMLAAAAAVIFTLLNEGRALEAARVRESRVQSFILATSKRAHDLDNHFYRFQEGLAHSAGRAESIISQRQGAEATVYLSTDFDDPARAPKDAEQSARYHGLTSVDHPVFVLAPGLDGQDVAQRLAELAGMRSILANLLVVTAGDIVDPLPPDALRARILGEGVPVLRSFVTLEDGIHIAYPGTDGYPSGFDERKRPAYLATEGRDDIVWGTPFRDDSTQQVVLAASVAIVDADGRRLGVAGLELTFDWITQNLLVMADAPYVESSYLVDREGNVVVAAGRIAGIGTANPTDDDLSLKPLPIPVVRQRLAARAPGHIELEDEGESKLIAFYPLDSVGWSYVVVADEDALIGRKPGTP